MSVPVVPSWIIEPIWEQFAALRPAWVVPHPTVGTGRRYPTGVAFDRLVQVRVCGCTYGRIGVAADRIYADHGLTGTTRD